MANRATALLLALLLLPLAAVAAPSPVFQAPDDYDPLALEEALGLFVQRVPLRKQGARVGDWFLHPLGFGFVIPEGLALEKKQTNAKTVQLLKPEGADRAFRTSVSMVIAKPDKGLNNLTPESVTEQYKGIFDRFELMELTHEPMYGVDGVSLTFTSGNAARLLVKQMIFVRDGNCFIITLTAENTPQELVKALSQFSVLRDSLIFLEP